MLITFTPLIHFCGWMDHFVLDILEHSGQKSAGSKTRFERVCLILFAWLHLFNLILMLQLFILYGTLYSFEGAYHQRRVL